MSSGLSHNDLYDIPQDLLDFRDLVRRLAQEQIAPRAAEIDRTAEYPWDVRQLLAEQDVLALPFATEYGGTGTGTLMLQMAVEEIAKVCASSALILMLQELGSLPISLFGSPELKDQWLPRFASGELAPAFALSEPEAGSDPAAMRTTAVRDGDEWVLNGAKNWISNAGIADTYVVFAKTDREGGRSSAFLVEADRPGFSIGNVEHKLGIKGSPTGSPVLEDVRVPSGNLIGQEGKGLSVALATLERTRLGAAAQAVGIAQGATDYANAYAKERIAFGKPINQLQAIQFKLADMETGTAAARELLYKACALVDRGTPGVGKYTSMAKLFASDNAMRVTVEAVQVLGGYGYVNDYPLERMMRDAKITQIYEGTNEIQRVVIARAMARVAPRLRRSLGQEALRGLLRAQLTSQDLPRDGLRQRVHDLDLPRVLVRSHSCLAERDQHLFVGRLTRPQADERLDGLATVRIGDPDHRRLEHRRMLVQDVLDLARPHLVAGCVDLIFHAVDHVEPALLVHEPDIAGVERSARERVRGLLRLLPVTRDYLRPRGDDLTNLAGR